MKYLLFTATVFCSIAFKSYAQEAPPTNQTFNFSIQDCVNYAYEHQNAVVNAGLDVKSAEYKVKETVGIGLPQISGSASFQDYIKTPSILFPNTADGLYQILHDEGVKGGDGNVIPLKKGGPVPFSIYQKYNSNVGVTLNQILFDGSYLVGLKASKTYKELSTKTLTRTKIDASVAVTKAYYQVLVSNKQLVLLDANIAQLKQQFDQTTAQNKQGFVEKIDVDRISVQYNNLVTSRENTIRLLALNYQVLKFQMGMPIDESLSLKDKLEDINLDSSIADASVTSDTSFYHNRIEYSLSETNVKLNELDLKRKKAAFLPTLSLNGNTAIAYQDNSFSKLYSTSYPSTYFGLSLNIPIFNGGQRINQVRQTQITVLKSKNDLYNLKNQISLQANQARITFINGLQSLNNQKNNQTLAQEVLRVSKIKYQQGVGSSIEVTQAQTALEDADNKYIQGLYDALVSKVDLDQAFGRIQ
ncbi:Outer membrane protein TolC [Mucilaginibacter pineti]|uniref:Outer membrane protein TolC n=1 Tax=Mucilaginibacter pineti TaxID=1391627 RepID=A0A1G6TMY3_9SPHI|nr:TolC family protein [Mucilaginibacter pineti]SDD29695.1 Outer membrane protein TolC [Mucilaginibacter pineti]